MGSWHRTLSTDVTPNRPSPAPPYLNFMGHGLAGICGARSPRAAARPATSQTPGEHPSPPRPTQRSTTGTGDRTFWLGTSLPCASGTCRFTPSCRQYPPSARWARSLRDAACSGGRMSACPATPILMPMPLQQCSRAALTAPAPGACGHTPCLRRARPPYAPAHTWLAHLQSAAYLSQTADWGSAVAGVTMVMVIPAGVAGSDGFFLKWWTLLTTCLRR
jgi:hypothetical protein